MRVTRFSFAQIGLAGLLSGLMLCFLIMPTGAFAQSQASTGQVAGTVRDQAGAVIAGATATITNINTGFSQKVTTDSSGLYRFVLLPSGTYRMTVSAQGFADYQAEGIPVEVGRVFDVDPKLSVGAAKESITVTAEGVEVTRHETSAFVNLATVNSIPLNGRRFQDLVNLTPTAQTEPSRSQISIAGQRGINTNVTIDGLDYNQPFFGGIRGGERSNFAPTIPIDAIQEFQVVETGYSAEFGRSTAGLITAVTRSGENTMHGSASYLVRPKEAASSNEYYDTVKANLPAALSDLEVKPAPTQHQWAATLGGPIVKDKLFYFGSYNQQRVRATRTVFFDRLVGLTPTTAQQEAYDYYISQQGPFDYTNDYKAFLGKVDYQFSANNRLNIRYSYSDNNSINGVGVGASITPTTNSAISNNGTEQDNIHTVVGQWTSFHGNFANDFRGQYSREQRPRPANVKAPTVGNSIGFFGTVSYLGENVEQDWRLQFADSVTLQKASHSFKFGFEYNHLNAGQTFGFNQYGSWGFSSSNIGNLLKYLSNAPGQNLLDDGDGRTISLLRQIGNLQTQMTAEQVAGFVQDSWRVLPNLTLNYGVRWEGMWNPQPEATNTALVSAVQGFRFPNGRSVNPAEFADQNNQVAPRLGFAWDPFNDSKTVIRGFTGIYYASTPLLLYSDPVNNFRSTPGNLSIRLPFSVPVGAGGSSSDPCASTTPWGCKSVYQQLNLAGINLNNYTAGTLPILNVNDINSVAAALGFTPDPFRNANVITFDPDFKNPRSYQAGFGIERQIQQGWTIGADFNWIKAVYLQRNRELNLPVPTLRSTTVDPAQRPFFGVTGAGAVARPIPTLSSVQSRESSAKSLYRGITLKSVMNRKRYQLNLYYTLSENLSDDDNERDSGGQAAVNTFDLSSEYSFSNLDRKHQFVAAPIVFLPYDFELSSSIRVVSGAPFTATYGSDANLDTINNDRPYAAKGVPFKRNAFRNKGISNVDLRVQKAFKFGETKKLYVSSEFFNLFNLMNLTYSGSAAFNYCSPTSVTCGFGAPTNPTFMQLRNSSDALLTSNSVGQVRQIQFGAKFVF